MNKPRLYILDTIRGLTLFGILIANLLLGYSGYLFLDPEYTQNFPTVFFDKVIIFLKNIFVDGKFYSIFSFLFGVGFGLQLISSNQDDATFLKTYRRRLFILLMIGIIHAFFWWADILILYALLGFVLILFYKRSPRFILICAITAYCLPLVIDFLRCFIYLYHQNNLDFFSIFSGENAQKIVEESLKINGKNNFHALFSANLIALKFRWFDIITTNRIFRVLGMFLFGLYVAKEQIFSHVDENKSFIKRMTILGLSIGLIINIFYTILIYYSQGQNVPDFHWMAKMVCYTLGVPLLAFGYVGLITLAYYYGPQDIFAGTLANVGKMALTNYLLQTVIGLILFQVVGLYQQVSATTCVGLAIIIFAAQIIFSNLWLKFFDFGPMEWLWRSLTYKNIFPMRKTNFARGGSHF